MFGLFVRNKRKQKPEPKPDAEPEYMGTVLNSKGDVYMKVHRYSNGRVSLTFANMPKYAVHFDEKALPQLIEILSKF